MGCAKIETTTGNICIEHTSAEELDLTVHTGRISVTSVTCMGDTRVRVTTGKTELTDLTCNNLTTEGDTGDIFLRNVIASEKFFITRSTGDVKFEGCDAGEIFIKTDTGDISGSLLTQKVFMTQTDTGNIHVPKTITGGVCEAITNTGDIRFEIQ